MFFQVALVPFAIAIIVSLYYTLYYFSRLSRHAKTQPDDQPNEHSLPPVSVVVCVHNEFESLQSLVKSLIEQDYPDYEIVIVDDRSNDQVYDYLLDINAREPKIGLVRINETPDFLNPKKFALTLGFKAACHDIVLLTDADCKPVSRHWIRTMQNKLSADKEIVLGYSPYLKQKGLLNVLIRYDTFYTAVQYLSMAIANAPYMGVGRNIGYRKNLFFRNKGFYKHIRITGGDDDLFVNRTVTKQNVSICLDKKSFTLSIPKTTFRSWFRQKKRHLSVGKYYKSSDKFRLGLLSASHVIFWVSFILLLFSPDLWVRGVALGGFLLRSVPQIIVFYRNSKKLEENFSWYQLPLLDFAFVFYYLVFGFSALFSKKIEWN